MVANNKRGEKLKKLLIIIPLALSLGFLGGCGSKGKVVVKEIEKEDPVAEEQEDAAEDTPKTEKKEETKVQSDGQEEKLTEDSKTVELEGASFKFRMNLRKWMLAKLNCLMSSFPSMVQPVSTLSLKIYPLPLT